MRMRMMGEGGCDEGEVGRRAHKSVTALPAAVSVVTSIVTLRRTTFLHNFAGDTYIDLRRSANGVA